MSRYTYTDEDGLDGIFENAMKAAMREDQKKMLTIVHVNQGYLNDISGMTVGEVKGLFAASELELDKKAERDGEAP